jgi:hypothetical protein
MTNEQKWELLKTLVETGAFAKYDLSVLVEKYGDWLLERRFGGPSSASG